MNNKVIFPIVREVVYYGHTYEKRMDEGEMVRCRFCGWEFPINGKTVHMAEDGMQMVCCPKCRRNVSILYFYDNTIRDTDKIPIPKKPKKSEKKYESTRMYFHSADFEKTHGYLEYIG